MPSSEYRNAVGGGLKLKGAKDSGVSKTKKKKLKVDSKVPEDSQRESTTKDEGTEQESSKGIEELNVAASEDVGDIEVEIKDAEGQVAKMKIASSGSLPGPDQS